jgi:3-oxoacyl-[acyl-carrier protein] reductase
MKNIVLAGGSKNLGNLIYKNLSKKFNVINLSRTSPKAKILKKNHYNCDLVNENAVINIFKKINNQFKEIDSIVFCVGNSKKTYKKNETIKDFKYAFDSNFFTFVNLLNAYLKIFNFKKTNIIVISSIAGIKISNAPITYSTAKSSLIYYCKYKSKELSKYKIRINIISPGNIFIKGNNWHKRSIKKETEIKNYIKKNVPLNKFINPNEIINICKYLIDENNNSITGSNFIIDGGETL